MPPPTPRNFEDSRRGFIRGSSLLLAGAIPGAAIAGAAHSGMAAVLPDVRPRRALKVGLIGCGYRGITLANRALGDRSFGPQQPWVTLTAVADAFPDRLQQALRSLKGKHSQQVQIDAQLRFVGLDAYRRLLETDVDLVLLATPPVFRPQHFSAAVEAGKHVLAESPVAVDSPGVRQFLAASELAQQRQLVVASGLTRRFDPAVQQTLEQLHRGAIGSMVMAQVYYHAPLGKLTPRRKSQSELEFQLRNWQHFSWSSGESVVEQQVQNLDVLSWLLGSHPVSARAIVGQHPLAPVDGEIPPGPTVEYTYGGGVKLLSMCGPSRGGWADLSASVQGTEGWCDLATGKIYNGKNELVWQASSSGVNSCAASVERLLLSAADCEGLLLNQSGQEIRASFAARGEGRLAAESTLAAILGRMARQADGELSWAQCAASPHRLANLEALQCLSAPPPAVLANS